MQTSAPRSALAWRRGAPRLREKHDWISAKASPDGDTAMTASGWVVLDAA